MNTFYTCRIANVWTRHVYASINGCICLYKWMYMPLYLSNSKRLDAPAAFRTPRSTYIDTYIRIDVYTHTQTHTHKHTHTHSIHTCICMYVCMYVYTYRCIYTYVHIYSCIEYTRTHTHLYVCIHTYIKGL